MEDCYKILGVEKDASFEEIKSAFREKALQCHPDKVPEGEKAWAHERFTAVSHAYFLLSEPDERRSYDKVINKPGPRPAYKFTTSEIVERLRRDFGDLFAEFFDEEMFLLLVDQDARMARGDLRDKEKKAVLLLAILTVPTVSVCLFLVCLLGFKIAGEKGMFVAILPALLLSGFVLGWLYNAIEKMYTTPFEKMLQRKFKDLLK